MIAYDAWDREYKERKQEYLEVFDKFMSSMNYENNDLFEKNFALTVGRKHVVSVASATDALYFSLLAYGIGPGDEVLVTDFSWISSSSCVSMTGATPVFCDINLISYHIDIDSIKRMYSEKVKAIIYPYLFGNMSNTDEIISFCKEKGIVFIEDAAQSFGSSLNGVKAGTIGDCSVYSFNSNKVVAGINGGGVVMTDDENIANQITKIRRHGKDGDFNVLGYNSRMYVLNAEIINLRLTTSEHTKVKRQEIASFYDEAFSRLPVFLQEKKEGLEHNYHKYVIRFNNEHVRDCVKQALNASVHYDTPLSENSLYLNIRHRKDNCINSKLVSKTILSLPVHAWLTNEELGTIIDTVVNITKEHS